MSGDKSETGVASDAEGSLDNLSLSSVQPILSNNAQDNDNGESEDTRKHLDAANGEEEEESDPILDRYFRACQKVTLRLLKK